MSSVPYFRQSACALREEIRPRSFATFALDRLDHERGHVAFFQLLLERREIIQRDPRVPAIHQLPEAFGETFATHERERPETEPMPAPGERKHPLPAGRGAGKLERAFDGFRAAVAKENGVEMRRRALGQRFREQPAQERAIHLHHVRQVELEHVADRLLHRRMVAADVEHGIAAQEVEVIPPIHVVKIGAFRARIDLVKTDHPLRCHQRAIEVLLVQIVVLAQPRGDDLLQVECHGLV